MAGSSNTFSKLYFIALNFDAFQIRVMWRKVNIMTTLLKMRWLSGVQKSLVTGLKINTGKITFICDT
jgi:hypothetical protein